MNHVKARKFTPKAVIFDLGGVVVDWNNSVTYRRIEEKHGLELSQVKSGLEKRLPLVQMGLLDEREWLEDFYRANGLEPDERDMEIWGTTFTGARVIDDVVAILRSLRGEGFKLAALSNIEPSRASEMRRREVMGLFDVVVFSCDEGTRKRSIVGHDGPTGKNIFRLTLDRLGLGPGECIYVDDNIQCVEAGKEVGIDGILYQNPQQVRRELGLRGIFLEG